MTFVPPPGPQAADLVRRLRAWTLTSWRHGDRIAVVRAALDGLAQLTAVADGHPRPPVPDAGPHALADQLAVLVADAQRVDAGGVDELLGNLAEQLGLSRR